MVNLPEIGAEPSSSAWIEPSYKKTSYLQAD